MHKPGYVYLVDFGMICKLGISTDHRTLKYRLTEYGMIYRNYVRSGYALDEPRLRHLLFVNDMRQSEVIIQRRWIAFRAHEPKTLAGGEYFNLPSSAIEWFASLRTDPI